MVIKGVEHRHQSGLPVATIRVTLPPNVDECNLAVRISAGNSAGMSSPTEITVRKLMTTFPQSGKAIVAIHLSLIF